MTGRRPKPQGTSGPISFGDGGANWEVVRFPEVKDEREQLVAKLFVNGFQHYVAMESEPSLAPFGEPIQNIENDLDFTVPTSQGEMLMELAEFAPLNELKATFSDAPKSLHPEEKADLALGLIMDKSAHQGGAGRFLVIHVTEQGFWLDPITIEILRRKLAGSPPRFERVYYVSPHNLQEASVSEIYPGKPHHTFGEMPESGFAQMMVSMPHPTEWTLVTSVEGLCQVNFGGRLVDTKIRIQYSGLKKLRH